MKSTLTREAVGPCVVEPHVGAEVDDDALAALCSVDGRDKRLADAVREGHNPSVNLAILLHAGDVLDGEVLVRDVRLGVALELLSGELARRYVRELNVRVRVEERDEVRSSVAAGTDERDSLRGGVRASRGRELATGGRSGVAAGRGRVGPTTKGWGRRKRRIFN